ADGAVAPVEAEDAGVADGVAQDADAGAGGQRVLGAGENLAGGEGDLAVGADLEPAVRRCVTVSSGEQVEQAGVVNLPAEQRGLVAAIRAGHVEGLRGGWARADGGEAQAAVDRLSAGEGVAPGQVGLGGFGGGGAGNLGVQVAGDHTLSCSGTAYFTGNGSA